MDTESGPTDLDNGVDVALALDALVDAVQAWHNAVAVADAKRAIVDEAIFYAEVTGAAPQDIVRLVRHPDGRVYTREQVGRIRRAQRAKIMRAAERAAEAIEIDALADQTATPTTAPHHGQVAS